MRKGCTVGCLGLISFITLLVAFVFWATSGVVASADAFLAVLGQGKIGEAYVSTTSRYQRHTSAEEFERLVKGVHLDKVVSASWLQRSMKNGTGRVQGNAIIQDRPLPLTMVLAKEGGVWKVDGVFPELDKSTPEPSPSAEAEQSPRDH